MENNTTNQVPLSEDTKSIITALMLVSIYPVGVVLMWMWTNWQKGVKWAVTFLGMIPFMFMAVILTFIILGSSSKEQRVRNNLDQIRPIQNAEYAPGEYYKGRMPGAAYGEDLDVITDPSEDMAPVNPDESNGTMCTMDALECPDGTFVGRSGPNCEFVCP